MAELGKVKQPLLTRRMNHFFRTLLAGYRNLDKEMNILTYILTRIQNQPIPIHGGMKIFKDEMMRELGYSYGSVLWRSWKILKMLKELGMVEVKNMNVLTDKGLKNCRCIVLSQNFIDYAEKLKRSWYYFGKFGTITASPEEMKELE